MKGEVHRLSGTQAQPTEPLVCSAHRRILVQEPQGGNPFESAIMCLCQHLVVVPRVIQNNVLDLEYKTSNVTEVSPLLHLFYDLSFMYIS